ncbi:MAG: hypothetical protein MJ252_14765 [archaeon]|nr:hypothetical protein [archaeon]
MEKTYQNETQKKNNQIIQTVSSIEEIKEKMGQILTEICEESSNSKKSIFSEDNDLISKKIFHLLLGQCFKPFIGKSVPSITIKGYLDRIIKYTQIEQSTLIIALIYIDRICAKNRLTLNFFNIYK